MKQLVLLSMISVCIMMTSCKRDSICDTLDCPPNSTCNVFSEECECDHFYEGENCEKESRSVYISQYLGAFSCGNEIIPSLTDIKISAGPEIDEIIIKSSDFLNGYEMIGKLDFDNHVTIPSFMASDSRFYSGYFESFSEEALVIVLIDEDGVECRILAT